MGKMTMKSTRRVLGHSLVRSLVRSHRSLIRFLRIACFTRALCCAHSLARSRAHGKEIYDYKLNASVSYSLDPLWIDAHKKWNIGECQYTKQMSLLNQFLVACTQLYTPLCRSVGQLVGRSVGRSVTHLFFRRFSISF